MAVLSLVMVAVVVWGVAFGSPLFHVRSIRVQGNVRLTTADVTELAGDIEGRNLLTLSLGEVRGRLMDSPWVGSALVTRSLPGTIRIELEERFPIAWAAGIETGAVVASDGVVLEHRPRRPDGLPTLGEVLALPLPGERLEAAELRVLAGLPPALRRQVERAEHRDGSVTLQLREGGRVLYGSMDLAGMKNAALESLLAWVAERGIEVEYIDVRAPASPTVKPVGAPPGTTLEPPSTVESAEITA